MIGKKKGRGVAGEEAAGGGAAQPGSPPAADTTAPRRSTHVAHEVVYAAVGASDMADLMRFPPEGSTPYESELRLGSGSERFLTASSLLMTWGAQRGAGIEVLDIAQGDGGQYSGVTFDEQGIPQPAEEVDVHFSPDGEAFLTAGSMATFRWPGGRAERRVRVVYTIDESRRSGYAWGTVDDAGAVGEQALAVEHREDDSVWGTVRGFLWAPDVSGRKGKAEIRFIIKESRRQLAALAPGATAGAKPADEPEA